MAEQEAIGLLEQLARDFNVRDPRKLFQIARREFPDRRDLTSARAAAALRGDVARQVLAPKPRSLGKSAAEGPNDRLQADLVDQNTRGRNKYGLVVQDVFTREIATKALPDKRAETVTRAAAEIIPDLVQEEGNYSSVTTDLGNEFQGLEAALPGGAVHRQKDPSDRNATAVVDQGDSNFEEGPSRHGGPEREAVGASTWTKQRRPTTPGHTRRSRWRRRTWRRCRQRPSESIRTMQPSFSTTRSLQKVANADWKKRAHSELRQMQEEASNRNTDQLAKLQALIPWLFGPQMEPKLC